MPLYLAFKEDKILLGGMLKRLTALECFSVS